MCANYVAVLKSLGTAIVPVVMVWWLVCLMYDHITLDPFRVFEEKCTFERTRAQWSTVVGFL